MQVLSCIMGDSDGSRAYWELVDKGLAESASVDADEMDRTGLIYAYAGADPEKIAQVTQILQRIMLTAKEFSDDDLTRAITKLRTRLVLQGESSMRRLMAIGTDWIYRGEYTTLDEELARLKAVNREGIYQALDRYNLSPLTVVTLLPES